MHLHKHSGLPTLYGKQYASNENKKTPPAAKCPGGAVTGKKRTRHQAALLHRPVACLSNK